MNTKVLIVDMNKEKNSIFYDEFVLPIARILKENNIDYKTLHFSNIKDMDKINTSFTHMILSGTPLKDNQQENDIIKFNWIRKVKIPLLGICAGMQVIGKIFGCDIINSKEIGFVEIKTTKENVLFRGDFKAYCLHSKSIKKSDFTEILAKSKNCIEAFKVKNKEIYGVLFHPEVRNYEIIQNFIKIQKTKNLN